MIWPWVLLAVLLTTFWVGMDHPYIERRYGRHAGDSTLAWVVGCLLLWIVVFPWYLVHRRNHRMDAFYGRPVLTADDGDDRGDESTVPGSFCGACGSPRAQPADRFCRECGQTLDA